MRDIIKITAFFCLLVCGVVALEKCADSSSVPILESPKWFLSGWRPNHENCSPSPGSATIDKLTDSVILDLLGANAPYYTHDFIGAWRCDTIGLWHGRTVVDLFYDIEVPSWENPVDTISYHAIKAIAMRTAGDRFRLLYESQTEVYGTHFERSTFVSVHNIDFLCTRSQVSGTGGFYDEAYWVWDDQQKVPRALDIRRAFLAGQAAVLPPRHAIWKGGFIDINSLSLTSFVHRNGDGNCCPTGGTIKINYKIEDGWLLVEHSQYDVAARYVSGIGVMEESSDSIYLKQGVREFSGESFSSPANRPDWQYFNAYELMFASAPAAQPLDSHIDSYVRGVVDGWIYGDARKATFSWRADTLGVLHGHPIVRVIYEVQNTSGGINGGKIIAVQLGLAQFRLIYLGVAKQPDSELAMDRVQLIDTDSVICVKGWLNGIRTYRDNYWIWPKESDVPVNLYQEWVLTESLNQAVDKNLPKGLMARQHRGTWDFQKLSYETYTWRKEDADSKPSGGRLKLQFGIRDNRLVPVDVSFNPLDTMTATN